MFKMLVDKKMIFGREVSIGAFINRNRYHSNQDVLFLRIGPNIKTWYFRAPMIYIKRKAEDLRDLLPGFTWRVQHCCDHYGRAYCGSLEFNWQRKNGYSGMYGDGPDSISPVPTLTALKLIYKKQTYKNYLRDEE